MGIAVFLLLAQSAITEPPAERKVDPYAKCVCEEEQSVADTRFVGLVRDARVTLAPGGLSVLSRQQTVFQVISSEDEGISGETAIWHETKPEDCGVTFDYGQRYTIPVRRVEDGFETSYCLKPKRVY